LLWQASHDSATGLANRKSFFRAIRRAWLRSPATTGGYAVGVIQLEINNPAGEAVGSEIRTPILPRAFPTAAPRCCLPAPVARAGESGLAFWIGGRPMATPPRRKPRRCSAH